MKQLWKKGKRKISGLMAAIIFLSSVRITIPAQASDIWPQKATAPFYCLDGGKGWKTVDRYDNYKYDTLPSPLTVTQTKRLFWAYPSNWQALKQASQKYDPALYAQIASTLSGPNTVKKVKDSGTTKFAWVADNPEIEARAIAVMEQASAEGTGTGKAAPEAIREATSEEKAVSFSVLPFSDGPGALDTEFVLGSEFIRDIAKIEPQSVWDNGSTGGNVGWLDASQDKNIAKSAMGENLYEITWSGDSIKIHNNGSAVANENAVGSTMSEEEKYNKTMVRYKITMRGNSGWYTEGSWNDDYLHQWMDFKACINAPNHQRLYKADIRIAPSDMFFYLVISQDGTGDNPSPEYGSDDPELTFCIYRHEETFESHYNVKLKKLDDETRMPLKGSQFYLYERFEDQNLLGGDESDAGLSREKISFSPWEDFLIFSEGTTDENGMLTHTDTRRYEYSKTYCDGHGIPQWAGLPEAEGDKESGGEVEIDEDSIEQTKDKNRAAAQAWMDLVEACEQEAAAGGGTHFHWMQDEDAYEEVSHVLENGGLEDAGSENGEEKARNVDLDDSGESAFESSGCKADCEETYEKFTGLRFTYTWKEIQARTGYILHDLHSDDIPIEMVTTTSSEAGAKSVVTEGSSQDILENIWYSGNTEAKEVRNSDGKKNEEVIEDAGWPMQAVSLFTERMIAALPAPATSFDTSTEAFDAIAADVRAVAAATASNAVAVGTVAAATGSNAIAVGTVAAATASNAIVVGTVAAATDSNAVAMGTGVTATDADAIFPWERRLVQIFSLRGTEASGEDSDDSDWEESGGGDFNSYLDMAKEDGIRHLETGKSDLFSHNKNMEDGVDFWEVRDHRTEGRIHINKRDLDLYKKEGDQYSSYGDTEGDGTLEGAVYGLFAAEDLVHPDAELAQNGNLTNTGIVYRKNDLTATAVTDGNGDADFLVYTRAPGMTYSYEVGCPVKRTDMDWTGPENVYEKNQKENGNYWIGRPLLLGKYYIKELSRSEGYELSVNGISREWSNAGAGFETPPHIGSASGTAVVSLPEISASMEGEDGNGTGYDQLPFSITSSETVNSVLGTDGYEIIVSGLPKDTEFYRVDSGEREVTGPHVTGTVEVPVKDKNGNQVWKKAESDKSNVKYEPEYDEKGNLTGQIPLSRMEWQILKAEQVPRNVLMKLERLELEQDRAILQERIRDHDLSDENDAAFLYIKAEVERILKENGYEIPVNWKGICSSEDAPVYSRGVKKGQPDQYGMTTTPGMAAVKTVYGAAVAPLPLKNMGTDISVNDVIMEIFAWYQNNPQWSFGGIDAVKKEGDTYTVILYAGASIRGSRRFFTMEMKNGKPEVDRVYSVLENPKTLRWEYQEYVSSGEYQYFVERQYYMGSQGEKRYYIDVTLTPAVMMNPDGKIQKINHQVMVYHSRGEEIVDYLEGDKSHGYRVPLTRTEDKMEITTEMELTETDVPLTEVTYDAGTGSYRILVKAEGTDSYGKRFTDENGRLSLSFMAKLPEKQVVLSEEDMKQLGNGNVYGYRSGDVIGYAEYLMRFGGASFCVSVNAKDNGSDTYIATKQLIYRGQNKISEDGGSKNTPVQVLERPIKQKIKVLKDVMDGEAIGNFRFKLYLKSNLERLFCGEDGTIVWMDKDGQQVDAELYHKNFPELVQKLYTKETSRRLLETISVKIENGAEGKSDMELYNYEKFFHGIQVANTDKWRNESEILNSSFKPFTQGLYTKTENTINSSEEARENARRSDAVRQFAVTWYLKEHMGTEETAAYTDERYDKALYAAILEAEKYLKPFFLYDLDSLYAISWDTEKEGGIDKDMTTLAAGHVKQNGEKVEYFYGISPYLPYGDYVLAEQQPFKARWMDFENRHYEIDAPKEISLPSVYEGEAESTFPGAYAEAYRYQKSDTPVCLAEKYFIRFNEEWSENHTEPEREYVVSCHNHDGDFEVYPYGLSPDKAKFYLTPYRNPAVSAYYHYNSISEQGSIENQVLFEGGKGGEENGKGLYLKDGVFAMTGVKTAYDGRYAPMLVPWTVIEPEKTEEMKGFACQTFLNRLYRAKIRLEKLDAETGEPILHEDAVFAFYAAERNEEKDGDGSVKRYGKETVIAGSRQFLEAMGAENITPFARTWSGLKTAGSAFYGTVPAGTPICREEDMIAFYDGTGIETGKRLGLTTIYDGGQGMYQTTGYAETPQPLEAGVYVLAELKPPSGYVRSNPIPVEVYSDAVSYYPDGEMEKAAAVLYTYGQRPDGNKPEDKLETARIYVNDTATSLEVSKIKTDVSYGGMKVSGRVEGSLSALRAIYGLENLELGYNSLGTYMGFGWKKGTLEYLEGRKEAGEPVEIVYENGVFQGYGYIMRELETADHENRYVAGAHMALYEAIEVRPSGDREDYAFEGLEIIRNRNGTVLDAIVKEGYAGKTVRFCKEDEEWKVKEEERKDTSVLFYDLGGMKVLYKDADGTLFGYGKSGERLKITFDTDSIYAIKGGRPVLELAGGDLAKVVYDEGAKAFTRLDENTVIYHLDEELCRDAQVDGYTGLAYVEKSGEGPLGQEEGHFYVWPVKILKDQYGNVLKREKILTGRPGEVNAGTEDAYITGTWDPVSGKFKKILKPEYDSFGMVRYYTGNGESYKKGEEVYDRDGDYLGYVFDDLLESYNRAAYMILNHEKLYSNGISVEHRSGEAWVIPNVWISGERTPQDPSDGEMTWGQEDLLRRVIPGTYIMEELKAPQGYVKALPVAVCVEEKERIQRVSMVDEKIKVEILKVDAADTYRLSVTENEMGAGPQWKTEGKGAYTNGAIEGVKLALYRANRIYTSDYAKYPKGYYMCKAEETPACWNVENPVDNSPVKVQAMWITGKTPEYFEGIPAGDYILEELDTPKGYIPERMEITVKPTSELQSFVLKNDHTKLEIFKYEKDSEGNKRPLTHPYEAELTLYPAVMDENGVAVKEGRQYKYEKENPVDTWISKDFSEYENAVTEAYKEMFSEYGSTFKEFSWKGTPGDGGTDARLLESHSTGNGETITQIWMMEDESRMRVTAVSADGRGKTDESGKPETTYEFQFHYREGGWEDAADMVSYDVEGGIHRIDRIPEGNYILVETKTPGGYRTAEPMLIKVERDKSVKRYFMENHPQNVYVDKTDENGNQISGAELELYRSDENGCFIRQEEYLIDRWISGTDGVYTPDDLAEGNIPKGYGPGDQRLHRLPPVSEGTCYLVEKRAPDYCVTMEPQLIEFHGAMETVIRAVNHPAQGRLVIEKQDAQWYGKKLSGARFEVKNKETGAVIYMETNEEGVAMSPKLPAGVRDTSGKIRPYEYQVKEVQAPDGYRRNLTVWNFRFENSNQATIFHHLRVENEETNLQFSKSNFQTGHFVSGASLAIYGTRTENGMYVLDGAPIETWISGDTPHLVTGKLSGNQTYALVEEKAPSGFSISPPVLFTVSEDGRRIIGITENFKKIQITYQNMEEQIVSVSVMGRRAVKTSYSLWKDGKETNYSSLSEVPEGEIVTVRENLTFSDGENLLAGTETFRVFQKDQREESLRGRIPVRTEYGFRNEDGQVFASWTVTDDNILYQVPGDENEKGGLCFSSGKTYYLEETVVFNDESRLLTGRTSILTGTGGQVETIDLADRETEVRIRKTDFATERELPGAVLAIKTPDGELLTQWISDGSGHEITGLLEPGKTYILEEIMAAEGFAYAEEIMFTISENGCTEKIKMEDKPTCAEIKKTDMVTGKELPGAKMVLKNREGVIIDQWISEIIPHVIKGMLTAGETYVLIEETAPEGYLTAEEVTFTVSLDGSVDRVVMQDKRTEPGEPKEPDEPEKPEEPDKPQKPEEPDKPEQPDEPDRPEKPKQPEEPDRPEKPENTETKKLQKSEKRFGKITAKYQTDVNGRAVAHVNASGWFRKQIPKTGDERTPWPYVSAISFLALGFLVIITRRKRHGK